jgi:hypothetical protein
MFFGSGLPSWDLTDLFGTHPPLETRIRRVDPTFDGTFPTVPLELVARWAGEDSAPERRGRDMAAAVAHFAAASLPEGRVAGPKRGGVPHRAGGPGAQGRVAPSTHAFRRSAPKPLLERLGDPGPEHLAHARALLAGIPPVLTEAARDRQGARALAYALLTSPDPDVWERQARLVSAEEAPLTPRVTASREALQKTTASVRLPLAEMLAGTLTELDAAEYEAFRVLAHRLVDLDGEVDLSEWILVSLLIRQLDGHFARRRGSRARYTRLSGLETEIAYVLSVLVHAAGAGEDGARHAFAKASAELRLAAGHLRPAAECSPRRVEAALEILAQLVPLQKRRLLSACAAAVAVDGQVSPSEAELFRVIAAWLDCPAPPLLPGQTIR